ncbi:MAG TPA: hypothetical protein VFU40_08705 [Gemmatimonadales bacterium]|nr:hypothetical protein [Gemmatimonadales bacterium]
MRGRRWAAAWSRARLLSGDALAELAFACEERDRLTFPTPADGVGPVTTIDQPNGADTTVFPGADLFVNGRTTDPDGVDTVYFFVIGGNQNFHPFHPNPVDDTVTFGLPITTFGQSGKTFTVQIYGVDVQGNQGTTSTRQIHVR